MATGAALTSPIAQRLLRHGRHPTPSSWPAWAGSSPRPPAALRARHRPPPPRSPPLGDILPVRGDFAIPAGQTWLNSAFIHPVPVAAANAVRSYLETRTFREPRLRSGDSLAAEVKAEFAALVNAKPSEISLVQSTSVAENLVVSGLGIAGRQRAAW